MSALWVAAGAKAASSAASAVASAPIPYLAEDAAIGPSWERMLGALVVCVLVGAVLVQWRRQGGLAGLRETRPRSLQILETQALDSKARLFVVRYGHEQLLLARSEQGVTLLRQGEAAAASASAAVEDAR